MLEILVICLSLSLCPLFVSLMNYFDAKYYNSELASKRDFKKVYRRAKWRYKTIKDKNISFENFLTFELKKYYEWEDFYYEWIEKR